ncbi:hypothetical protein OGAPHI_007340 [Ogataea philodendri]|uniref:Uncharacterized protein n=1 Tax=Ogataea philodendri TaxID=1378263 RepID=A0A9P8NUV6_9ASCO|nr:uncharacterized protein OGAPHI_007340 [Ogataea philodendri]KAH3660135.1 hypothetical protein OGAPHI_007340 [Ogataea philodendri]
MKGKNWFCFDIMVVNKATCLLDSSCWSEFLIKVAYRRTRSESWGSCETPSNMTDQLGTFLPLSAKASVVKTHTLPADWKSSFSSTELYTSSPSETCSRTSIKMSDSTAVLDSDC